MTNIAIIRTGGKQLKVKEGDLVLIEKILGEKGDKVEFETLLIADEDGSTVEIGQPLTKIQIGGEIVEQTREAKILVIKFRAKSRYRRRHGHMQKKTEVKIGKI